MGLGFGEPRGVTQRVRLAGSSAHPSGFWKGPPPGVFHAGGCEAVLLNRNYLRFFLHGLVIGSGRDFENTEGIGLSTFRFFLYIVSLRQCYKFYRLLSRSILLFH